MSKIRTKSFSVSKKPCQRDPGGQTLTLTCKDIDRAWNILDIEFAKKRKLMDELLTEINSHGLVKDDPKESDSLCDNDICVCERYVGQWMSSSRRLRSTIFHVKTPIKT